MYTYSQKCSLLISSSDDYETAWYPLFELIKRQWPNHPKNIFLNSETKSYGDNELNIINILGGKERSWSERLYRCLEKIDTDYVIFSLEDAFLLGAVDDEIIEKCFNWMEENGQISVCRLKSSNDEHLIANEKYAPFRIAGDDVPYRLDTQVALWRKKDLMNFLDFSESPWEFEEKGTQRILRNKKIFLWHYVENEDMIDTMVYPYHIFQLKGYGIAWGRWLWANKKWFKQNGIRDVKFGKLGVLPKWAVYLRWKYLYRANKGPAKGFAKIFQAIYKKVD